MSFLRVSKLSFISNSVKIFLQIPTDGFTCSIVFYCIFEFDIRNLTADESKAGASVTSCNQVRVM